MLLSRSTRLIFDFDGTLVDSIPLHERAFRTVLAEMRPDLLPSFDYTLYKGRETSSVFRDLGVGPDAAQTLASAKRSAYEAAVQRGELIFMPGAKACLDAVAARDMRRYVATSGSRVSVGAAMTALGIVSHFEGVLTATEVPLGKPAPDIFLQALERFNIDPEDAIVIEDSLNGVRAARAAGLRVVGVYDGLIEREVDLFLPTLDLLMEYIQ